MKESEFFSSELSHTAKVLYMFLDMKDLDGFRGGVEISLDRLQREVQMTQPTIISAIRMLVQANLISVKQGLGGKRSVYSVIGFE